MKSFLLAILLCSAQFVLAQNNGKLLGIIVDGKNAPLEKATISVMHLQDSIVYAYLLSNAKGQFEFVRLPTQKDLIVFVTHVNGDTYEKRFKLQPNESLRLDTIRLTGKRLDEVVINPVSPIRMKGDTLEYKAEYFKTRPNANVEELLSLLPGLQVNLDGSIYFQGRKVSGIRVNNKDFFAQDLTIATKNLDASLIEAVQVIKDKGESKLEIIDDKNLPIVINLKTKKEFLKADFGKFYAGGGTHNRYEGGALVNTFRDTLQVSFIGFANNLNRSGFDYSELSQYGGANRAENYNQVYYGFGGITNKKSAGINVNYDIKKVWKFNLMYNYEHMKNNQASQNASTSFFDEITENALNKSEDITNNHNHALRAFARVNPDSTSRISLDINLKKFVSNSNNGNITNTIRNQSIPVVDMNNSALVDRNGDSYRHQFNAEKSFSKKWILSFFNSFSSSQDNSNQESFQQGHYYLLNPNPIDLKQLNDKSENKIETDNKLNMQYKPVKKLIVNAFIQYNWENKRVLYDYWNKPEGQELQNRNDIAGNLRINENSFYQGINVISKWIKDVDIQLGVQHLQLDRRYDYYEKLPSGSYKNHYFLPNGSVTYQGATLRYSKTVNTPYYYYFNVSSTSDYYPDFINLPSPYFDNVLNENISLDYYQYFSKPKINFSTYISYNKASNSIGQKRNYNLNNSFSTNQNYQAGAVANNYGYITISRPFVQSKNWKVNANVWFNMSNYQRFNSINDLENKSTSYDMSLNPELSVSYKNKITLSPAYSFNYTATHHSNKSDFFQPNTFNSHKFGAKLLLNDVYKFRLETSYNLLRQNRSLAGSRQSAHLVNASLYYPVLKKGELKLTAYDILNQNISTFVYSNANTNVVSQTMVLKQYFILGFVYKVLATKK